MLRFFMILGIVEGLSTLALIGIAMPMKYFFGMPEAVSLVGAAHGFLFILYLYALFATVYFDRLPKRFIWGGILAAFLPFGPFVLDRSLLIWKRHSSESGFERM